jgi:lipopolysaccharide export system protein LptA
MFGWGFTSAVVILVWGVSISAAQPPDRGTAALPADIIITSQSLVFKNQENSAVFEGKVVLTKGEFVMHADQMVVHFEGGSVGAVSPKGGKAGGQSARPVAPDLPTFGNRAVSLIDATGNVVMEQGKKKAKSKKALYYQRDEKLVLTGDPEVWEQGYRVTGVKMTMLLKEDRSIVEGSRVVINDTEQGPR